MSKLTPKQQRFVDEYLVDLNGSAAYKRAGYKATGNAAEVEAHRLLRNPKIEALIQQRMNDRSVRTQITADDVVCQLARMGMADVRKLFTAQGHLKAVHELDDDTAAAVQSIEVVTKTIPMPGDEPSEVEYLHKIKLVDKIKPLELIGKHMGKELGQWAENHKVEHSAGKSLQELLQSLGESHD
nr:terminase small subunit [uncultured Halomonas sp.]